MKIISSIAIILLPVFASSQITITENDMPSAGAVYFSDNVNPGSSVDLNQTGANQTWDFSDLVFTSASADSFISNNDLPFVYQLVFLSSNLAEKSGLTLSFGQLMLEDVYTIFKKSSSQFQIDGYAGTFEGVPLPIPYSSKDIVYRFPINYGNSDSSDASLTISIPGLGYVQQQRHRVNQVDGWGSISTPVGSYNVLRVKSTITDIDSVYADTLGFGSTLTLKSYEYKWLAQGKGIPVMQITAQDVAGIPVISQILYQDTTLQSGISETSAGASFNLFPNPANDYLKIEFSDHQHATSFIYDSEGKLMSNELASGRIRIDVSRWQNGIYFLLCNQNNHLFTSSFIVSH